MQEQKYLRKSEKITSTNISNSSCRFTSKRILSKSQKCSFDKTLNGRSLLEIAISNALMSDQINDLVISSESQRVFKLFQRARDQKACPKAPIIF